MGFLANLIHTKHAAKAQERVDEAMSKVEAKTDELVQAVARFDRIMRSGVEVTIDRTFAENARLTGRKRR